MAGFKKVQSSKFKVQSSNTLCAVVVTLCVFVFAIAADASWIDNFDDSSLDTAKFGTSVAGDGAVAESGDTLNITMGANVANAGMVYLKNTIDQTKSEFFQHKVKVPSMLDGGMVYLFNIIHKATAPIVDTTTNFVPTIRMMAEINRSGSTYNFYLMYFSSAGTWYYWNGTSWTTTNSVALTVSVDTFYIIQFVHTTTQWKYIILDGSGNKELAHTDWVNFSSLKSDYSTLWLFWGEPYTNVWYGNTTSDFVEFGNDAVIEGWYSGGNCVAHAAIGRAISYNSGKAFIREPKTGIITYLHAGWQANEVTDIHAPWIIKDGSTYYMWVDHWNSSNNKYSISCFTSSDGITWTRSGTAPKLTFGGAGSIDELGVYFPVVVKDLSEADPAKRWKIFYASINGSSVFQISYAYFADPTDTTYTKYASNPIIPLGTAGAWDDKWMLPTALLIEGSNIRLYYGGLDSIATAHWQGGEASSTNWTSWTKNVNNPIHARRISITTGITILASDSVTATVADTSIFIAKEWIVLVNSADTGFMLNRIQSIDSATQVTLSYPANALFTSGKMKSAYFGSVIATSIKSGIGYTVVYQFGDIASYLGENSSYMTGTDHETWEYDLNTYSPVLPIGVTWDTKSAENLRLIELPVTLITGTSYDVAAAFAGSTGISDTGLLGIYPSLVFSAGISFADTGLKDMYPSTPSFAMTASLSNSGFADMQPVLSFPASTSFADSGVNVMQLALNLPAGASLLDIGSLDLLSSLSFPVNISHNAANTVDFAVSLALSAISTLQENNLITAQSAILLSSAVTYSNINYVDWNVLLALASQASYMTQTEGGIYNVALILSAISQLIGGNSLSIQGALSLTGSAGLQEINTLDLTSAMILNSSVSQLQSNLAVWSTMLSLSSQIAQDNSNMAIYPVNLTLSASADISNINSLITEGIISLVAQGNINAAAQLATYGGLVLQSTSQISDSNTIDWNVLLTLSGQASQLYSITGSSIDVYTVLSAVAQALNSGTLSLTSDITLSASASIITLLSSVIREGILTLTAQGDINTAAQLSAYGGLILNAISQSTDSSNQIFYVPLILEAVAQAVVTGDMSLLQNLLWGIPLGWGMIR